MGTFSSYFLPRFFLGTLLVGLVCLLVVGSLGSGVGTTNPTTLSTESSERLKQEHVIGNSDKPLNHAELDFNYMSKRRIPNGPDPIHNRFQTQFEVS
ncbi:CLAVATA3/ESR (CLE)-related protein 25-like isoform X2 [Gastrolobium bilobum]|uniref:CLAVATA3/ESR (CLE)-related protein 25-like isoform X2 n=1 Tax=Gastrolobium bilobum TaxID=150636 RepID=UPI002AB24BED|nr:CLAVATA3/ESR (CLE)-related protein 25-like isoform X2 [Gastrolobium bilobum]